MKKGLTLQFVPYNEIGKLDSNSKIKKILKVVKDNKIVLLEGKLKSEEEAMLIQRTMEQIDRNFKGIEIATIEGKDEKDFIAVLKKNLARALLGDKFGLTIIGPASIVKEIKKDPNKIELFTNK
ncbi:DUF2073 domain-containing protein [Candidatus Woesearchaeota archaeon]|nr:DUF2073 domain-containing protein [Candidatus Woesearchaeota archaeon]